jgi:hypothetical protein
MVYQLHLRVQGLLCHDQDSTSEELQPLLDFISTSQALCSVVLCDGVGLEDLTARLLEAVALNSNITEFTLNDDLHPSPQSFARFLATASFLRELKVDVQAFVNHADQDLALVGAAFGQNRTLQELDLYSSFTSDNESGESLLRHVGSHANNLHTLSLEGSQATIGQFQALATVLLSTQTLSHLNMANYNFDLDCMEIFVAALRSNTTVTYLYFQCCTMERGPFDLWTQFLKSGESKICELAFLPYVSDDDWRDEPFGVLDDVLEGNMLDSSVIGKSLVDMLTHSSIRHLDLDDEEFRGIPSYALLLDGMTCHESEIRLSRLLIQSLDERGVDALAQFLPHSSQLQELDICRLSNYRLLFSAIRQNGSLRVVHLSKSDKVLLNWIPACCQRNEMVPKLLARSQSDTEGTDDNDAATLDRIDPCHVPTIMFVSQQAPRMAPNNILIGLLGVLGSNDAASPLQVAHVGQRVSHQVRK